MESRRVFFSWLNVFWIFQPRNLGEDETQIDLLVHHMGVSKDRGTPKWMVSKENPIRIDDLGVPLFLEAPICFQVGWFNQNHQLRIMQDPDHIFTSKGSKGPTTSGGPREFWQVIPRFWMGKKLWVVSWTFFEKTKRYEKKKSLRNVPKTQKNGELFFFSKKGKGDPNSFFVTGILPSKGRMTSLYFKKMAIATPKWWMSFWATNKPQKVTNSSRQFFALRTEEAWELIYPHIWILQMLIYDHVFLGKLRDTFPRIGISKSVLQGEEKKHDFFLVEVTSPKTNMAMGNASSNGSLKSDQFKRKVLFQPLSFRPLKISGARWNWTIQARISINVSFNIRRSKPPQIFQLYIFLNVSNNFQKASLPV